MKCRSKTLYILLLLLSTLLGGPLLAADWSREARLREALENTIQVGRPITLSAEGHPFLAIYTEADTDKTVGAAIILPDIGASPDQATVIRPLRNRLPTHGWATLALQMPLAASDAPPRAWRRLVARAGPRIDSAIARLRDSGVLNIALIGHGVGAEIGLRYLAGKRADAIRAFVAIGLGPHPRDPEDPVLRALEKLKLPILDVFGGEDLAAARDSARARRAAARKANNPGYLQLRIDGADHRFHDLQDVLTSRVRAWLNRVARGTEIAR